MIAAAADARRTLHPEALITLVMRRGKETSLSHALHFLSSEGRKEAVCTDTINFSLFKLPKIMLNNFFISVAPGYLIEIKYRPSKPSKRLNEYGIWFQFCTYLMWRDSDVQTLKTSQTKTSNTNASSKCLVFISTVLLSPSLLLLMINIPHLAQQNNFTKQSQPFCFSYRKAFLLILMVFNYSFFSVIILEFK